MNPSESIHIQKFHSAEKETSKRNIPQINMNPSESIHIQEFHSATNSIKKARTKFLQKAAYDRARELHKQNFESSKIPDMSKAYPEFSLEELCQGSFLGKGAFATVYEVRGFGIPNSKSAKNTVTPFSSSEGSSALLPLDEQVRKGEIESRLFIANHCIRHRGDARYAVKRIRPNVEKHLDQAISDLATETRILANLEHPHIIKLRAIASGSRFDKDFFIVLDRLYATLHERMECWSNEMKKLKGLAGKLHDWDGHKRAALYHQRIHAAYHLGSALWYLHNKRIIHRDLKPENISFDLRGDLKLFDFGLAKELPSTGADEHGLFHLTSKTGSPRYMAPEVALGESYNESCDVYSFAILLWEMLALKNAFVSYSITGLYQNVFSMPYKRPMINPKWHTTLKKLLHYAWSPLIEDRPKMCVFKSILKEECSEFCDDDNEIQVDEIRRSTYIYDQAKRAFRKNSMVGHHDADDSSYLFEERGFWKSVATNV